LECKIILLTEKTSYFPHNHKKPEEILHDTKTYI